MKFATIQALLLAALVSVTAAAVVNGRLPTPKYQTPEFWSQSAKKQMEETQRHWQQLRYEAKSAILFIGDGMGPTTVTAGRIFKGQLANNSGEEAQLEFDEFPHVGLVKTYSADGQTPDSAATATAFTSGVKTNDGNIGVNHHVTNGLCSTYSPQQHDLESFLAQAQREGKSVGIVTTTRITHATPAAGYANSPSRNWESDTDRNADTDSTEDKQKCKDIATQLIEKGINYTVMIGGGREKFLPKEKLTIDRVNNDTVPGERSDKVDLIELWKRRQASAGRRARYVETTEELLNLDASSTDYLLALLSISHLSYHIDNQLRTDVHKQPTIAQMVEVALRLLKKNEKGFVLLVEGGRIDHAHHANRAHRALYEVVAMDAAVGVAKRHTNREETLIVVSADHSHVFTIGHYGRRGQRITDKMTQSNNDSVLQLGEDDLPFTVLHYADGKSARNGKGRKDITDEDLATDFKFRYQSLVPNSKESHGGEDVAIYATGPGAQLFNSVQEQSYIAHAVMKAACIGWYRSNDKCLKEPKSNIDSAATAAAVSSASVIVVAVAMVAFLTESILC